MPGTDDYNKYIRQATGKSGTNINVNTGKAFTKEQEEAGKKRVARIEKLYFTPAENSQETISNILYVSKLTKTNRKKIIITIFLLVYRCC